MIAVGLGQHSAVYRSSGSRELLQIDCHENGQWCCGKHRIDEGDLELPVTSDLSRGGFFTVPATGLKR